MKEKNKAQQFIYTMDKDVSDYLIKNGFILLSENNGNYTFMNNGKLRFESEEDKNILTKIAYTNVLCF